MRNCHSILLPLSSEGAVFPERPSQTVRPRSSAVSLPVSPAQTVSPFLQRCWTLSCPNLPASRSPLRRFQNQIAARPTRCRCPPDTGRQRRLFFCSFCGTRSASASRYGQARFPAASDAACQASAGRIAPYRWLAFLQNPPLNLQRWTAWTRG